MTFLLDTPVGPLRIVSDGAAISEIHFVDAKDAGAYPLGPSARDDAAALVTDELRRYFEGSLRRFTVPVNPHGTTFQRAVWDLLTQIPYGETTTYGELARRLGDEKKTRAVGAANGRNPIAIVVPCHRVIGADGALTGFAGGLDRKAALLAHEQDVAGTSGAGQRELFSNETRLPA